MRRSAPDEAYLLHPLAVERSSGDWLGDNFAACDKAGWRSEEDFAAWLAEEGH